MDNFLTGEALFGVPCGRGKAAWGDGDAENTRAHTIPFFPSLGRSMIEMLGVLAIIGVLSAGGIWGYNAAMEHYRFNKLIGDMNQMAATAHYLFPKASPTARIMCGRLYQAGILPKEYYDKMENKDSSNYTACPTKHSFNDNMLVDILYKAQQDFTDHNGSSKAIKNTTQLAFHLYNIPKGVCQRLVTFANPTALMALVPSVSYDIVPLTREMAETYCEENHTHIVYLYYLNGAVTNAVQP